MVKKRLAIFLVLFVIGVSVNAQCPTADAGSSLSICQGDTIQLIGSDPGLGSPEWYAEPTVVLGFEFPNLLVRLIPDGLNDTIQASVLIAGTYKMFYEITTDGCPTVKDSMDLIVNAPPSSSIVSPSGGGGFGGNASIASCTGQTTFTVTGNSPGVGETGVWAIKAPGIGSVSQVPGDSTAVVSGLSMGTTELTWTIDNGSCSSVSTVTIETSNTGPTVADAGSDLSGVCGQTLELIGSVATSGDPVWSNAYPPAGFFTPSISFTPFTGANDSVSVSLDAPGVYTLYYTISIGPVNVGDACTSIDSLQLTVTGDCSVGIEGLSSQEQSSLSVQPNPASGNVTISLDDESNGIAIISILSTDGIVLLTELAVGGGLNQTIDISNLSSGVYIVKVLKGDGVYTSILVVQ